MGQQMSRYQETHARLSQAKASCDQLLSKKRYQAQTTRMQPTVEIALHRIKDAAALDSLMGTCNTARTFINQLKVATRFDLFMSASNHRGKLIVSFFIRNADTPHSLRTLVATELSQMCSLMLKRHRLSHNSLDTLFNTPYQCVVDPRHHAIVCAAASSINCQVHLKTIKDTWHLDSEVNAARWAIYTGTLQVIEKSCLTSQEI